MVRRGQNELRCSGPRGGLRRSSEPARGRRRKAPISEFAGVCSLIRFSAPRLSAGHLRRIQFFLMPPRKVPKFKPIIKLVEKDLKALDILATGDKLSFIDHIRRTTCSSIENLDSLSDDSLLRGIVTGCSGPKSLHFMKAAAESYKHAVESRRSAKLQLSRKLN